MSVDIPKIVLLLRNQSKFNKFLFKAVKHLIKNANTFDESTITFTGSITDGSNAARLFDYQDGHIEIEVDIAATVMRLPKELAEWWIFTDGRLNNDTGEVEVIYKTQFSEYIINFYKEWIKLGEKFEIVSNGKPVEPIMLLETITLTFSSPLDYQESISLRLKYAMPEVRVLFI